MNGPSDCWTATLVVPGIGPTSETSLPSNRLNSVDLPEFTGPIIASLAAASLRTPERRSSQSRERSTMRTSSMTVGNWRAAEAKVLKLGGGDLRIIGIPGYQNFG